MARRISASLIERFDILACGPLAEPIYSFIIVRHPSCHGYLNDLPYIVALVELDEQMGLRLPVRLVGVAPGRVRIGQRVRTEIIDLPGGEFRVPVFRVEPATDGPDT